VIGDRICPMCRATVRVDLTRTTAVCAACDARFVPALAAEAVVAVEMTSATALDHHAPSGTALERDDPERARHARNVSVLSFFAGLGVLYGALKLGVSSGWTIVMLAVAAVVGIGVLYERVSRRPTLPGATAALRRDRRRALPPPE
jgi:hypothetical protein